jgi:hypothetical protein
LGRKQPTIPRLKGRYVGYRATMCATDAGRQIMLIAIARR